MSQLPYLPYGSETDMPDTSSADHPEDSRGIYGIYKERNDSRSGGASRARSAYAKPPPVGAETAPADVRVHSTSNRGEASGY